MRTPARVRSAARASVLVAIVGGCTGVKIESPLDDLDLDDVSDWESRRAALRAGILETLAIDDAAARAPVTVVWGARAVLGDYVIDNVALEVLPGLWVAGNLYAPATIPGRVPAVLNPHGHFEVAGYSPRTRPDMQTRCGQLARMGAVAFTWDMFGYGEALQVDHHGPDIARLVTWTSLRALEFVRALPEVDPARIAVTGASGGASQTIVLTALDDRVAVSVPVAMVSVWTAGNCGCERYTPSWLASGNVEVAAMAAPRPQLVISDVGDWTMTTPYIELPFLRRVYGLYDAEPEIENVHLMNEAHDYGASKRRAAYRFLAQHLGLREDLEEQVTLVAHERLLVWDAAHPRPW